MASGILLVNIGNSNISLSLYKNERISFIKNVPAKPASIKKLKFPAEKNISRAYIASVAPGLTKLVKKRIKCRVYVLNNNDIPIKNLYRKKTEAGIDRLLESLAARERYGAPLIVADFGTATTLNIVSKKGEFRGGMILPGVKMWGEYLYEKTSKLPKVEFKKAKKPVGITTKECIQNGIYYGNIDMLDGLIARLKNGLGKRTKVISTGGFARFISPYIEQIDKVDQSLIFTGMVKTIHYKNSSIL